MQNILRKLSIAAIVLNLLNSSVLNATDCPFDILGKDCKLEVMKRPGVAKALFAVNRSFYELAHDPLLQDCIQHGIPSSEELEKHSTFRFLPTVKLKFQATCQELQRLQGVVFLDLSSMLFGKNEAIVLLHMPSIVRLSLGARYDYFDWAKQLKSLDGRQSRGGPAYLRAMIKDPDHPRHYEAADLLVTDAFWDEESQTLKYGEEEDIQAGIQALLVISQNAAHPKSKDALRSLFASNDLEMRQRLIPNFLCLMQDPTFLGRQKIAQNLLRNEEGEVRDAAETTLIECAHDKTNPDRFLVACDLIKHGTKRGQLVAMKVCQDVAMRRTGIWRYHAASWLFPMQDQHAKDVAIRVFRAVLRQPADPNLVDAAEKLYSLGNEADQKLAGPVLREAIHDATYIMRFYAAKMLLRSSIDEDKAAAKAMLIAIAQDKTDSERCNAAVHLIYYGDEEEQTVAEGVLFEAIKDKQNPNRYENALSLYSHGHDAEAKKVAISVLIEAMQDKEYADRFDVAEYLMRSGTEEAKKVADAVIAEYPEKSLDREHL
jgi:hypothetical protein